MAHDFSVKTLGHFSIMKKEKLNYSRLRVRKKHKELITKINVYLINHRVIV